MGSHFKGTVHPGGKAWQQEGEAVGHLTSPVRKQRATKAGVKICTICSNLRVSVAWSQRLILCSLLSYSFKDPNPWDGAAHR